nr:hypothetical protein [Tanacetum cinerariifolium]
MGIDETDCYHKDEIHFIERLLYDNSSPHPPKEFVSKNSNADTESFSPSPIPNEDSDFFMEEIDLSFNLDDPMPSSIEDDDNYSEGDILSLERLLHDDPIPLPDTLEFSYEILACYDDDDDDYAFAITPNEPVNSLSTGDELLDTISTTESDEIQKVYDDQSFSDEDFSKEIYSNPLFDEEIIPIKIDPHHFNAESDLIESMLNHNSLIISSLKIDSLFDEFAGELTLLKSVPPGIDVTNCHHEEENLFVKRLLYDNSSPRPPKEFVSENYDAEIKSFSPSPIPVEDSDSLIEEIDLSFTLDYPMPPSIKYDDYDSERDILILDELLSNNSLSLPENESFYFDIPSSFRPPAKSPDGNT